MSLTALSGRARSSGQGLLSSKAPAGAIILTLSLALMTVIGVCSNVSVGAPTGQNRFAAVDAQWARRSDPSTVDKLIADLEEMNRRTPKDSEVLWRLARAYRWKADRVVGGDKNTRVELLERAKAAAEAATIAGPKNAEAFYWLSVTAGSLGRARGILQSVFLVKTVKEAAETAVALEPKHAGAHYALAELYRHAPGPPISIGDKQKALQEARIAVKIEPDDSDYQLCLGLILVSIKEYTEARDVLYRVLALPLDPEDPQLTLDNQATARAELAAIQKK